MKDLPIFKMSISNDDEDNVEVDFIALVDSPAIKKNFLAYDNKLRYSINEEERIVTGLAMIADLPIYRRDDTGEYYTVFDAITIKQIAQRFFRKKYNFNLNLDHKKELQPEGVYIFESWIVDREKGKHPIEAFSDVANGSWIVSAKIDNEEIWNDVKDGKFNGFSVEGVFAMERVNDDDMTEEEFIEALKKLKQQARA